MKKASYLLLLFFFFLFIQFGYSQNKKVKFGKLDKADLEMTTYEQDPDAPAVILYEKGLAQIVYTQAGDGGFKLQFEKHQRIKILKETGKDWANFSIALYHNSKGDKEKLQGLKAITYNEDGKAVKEDRLDSDQIFEEKLNNNWTLTKFAMPNVKVGSVIEIKYKIESDFLFNFREWNFQHEIPCKWSEYFTEIPEYFRYNKNMRGYELSRLTVNEVSSRSERISFSGVSRSFDGRRMTSQTYNEGIDLRVDQNHWVIENMPGFKEEAFMLNKDDYLTGVEFELSAINYPGQPEELITSNWKEIQSELDQHPNFGQQLKRKGWVKDIVARIEEDSTSEEEKIVTAYRLIRSKMSWTGRENFLSSSSIKKSFEEGKGNTADINLTLVLLLQELGINAAPVLVSTRDNGRINPIHPSLTQFNYVVVGAKIGERILFLDATSKILPPGMLPVRCLNDRGRWIGTHGNEWVGLVPDKGAVETSQMVLQLGEGNKLEGEIKRSLKKYRAYQFRADLLESESEEAYFENWAKDHEGFTVTKHQVENTNLFGKDILQELEVSFEDKVEEADDLLFFTPLLLFAKTENPFKQEERLYPVNYPYPINEKFLLKFQIPEGYILEEVPEKLAMSLPDNAAKYIYSITEMNDFVLISSTLKINKLEYLAQDYGSLKTFYDTMVEKQSEQLVLKKK